MDKIGALITAIWSVIREPLYLYLSFIAGKKAQENETKLEAQSSEIKDLHRYVVLSNARIADDDVKRLRDKYIADE